MPIYILQRFDGIETEGVRSEADDGPVDLVLAPQLKMSVPLVRMVPVIPVRDPRPERSWVFRQGVERETIDDRSDNLNSRD